MRVLALILLALTIPLHAALTPSKAELHAWLDEAFTAIHEVPQEHRRTLAYSLPKPDDRTERIRIALFKIALRPSGNGWFDLVKAMEIPPEDSSWTGREYNERRQTAFEFLDAIYRARAGTDNADARQWQQGLAEILFCTGNFTEALRLAREVDTNESNVAYRTILLAMMEKVAGNNEPFAKIRIDCPQPAYANEGTGAKYCTTVIQSVAHRMLATLEPDRVPAVVREMLTGGDWQERMHGFEVLRGGGAKVRGQLEEIVTSPDAPDWAKDDAIFALARHARKSSEWTRAASLIDCWFTRRAIAFPPVTTDTWQQVADMPFDPTNTVDAEPFCYRHHDPQQDIPIECILYGLQTKVIGASTAKDQAAVRAALEALATVVSATGHGLLSLSTFLQNEVDGKERDQTLQYVATMQIPAALGENVAAAVRKQTTSAPLVPWEPLHRNTTNAPPAVVCPN